MNNLELIKHLKYIIDTQQKLIDELSMHAIQPPLWISLTDEVSVVDGEIARELYFDQFKKPVQSWGEAVSKDLMDAINKHDNGAHRYNKKSEDENE